MERHTDVMIIDTDRSRVKSLRRILTEARPELRVDEVTQVAGCRDKVLQKRPSLVLLHTTFPYLEEDGTGLLELIQEDFRTTRTSVILVLPMPSYLVYRTGYQEGIEILDMADDLITTDYTSDMIQNMVLTVLDQKAALEAAWEAEPQGVPEYALVTKQV
ncbi:response regulator [Deferrisoma sp.]